MPFLSNLNILVGIMLGPTDLLESNEEDIFGVRHFLFLFYQWDL